LPVFFFILSALVGLYFSKLFFSLGVKASILGMRISVTMVARSCKT